MVKPAATACRPATTHRHRREQTRLAFRHSRPEQKPPTILPPTMPEADSATWTRPELPAPDPAPRDGQQLEKRARGRDDQVPRAETCVSADEWCPRCRRCLLEGWPQRGRAA